MNQVACEILSVADFRNFGKSCSAVRNVIISPSASARRTLFKGYYDLPAGKEQNMLWKKLLRRKKIRWGIVIFEYGLDLGTPHSVRTAQEVKHLELARELIVGKSDRSYT